MLRRCWLGWALVSPLGARAEAAPTEIAAELPDARLRGQGSLRFFGLHIYDGRVWSAAPVMGDGSAQPLAIELIYARRLHGDKIASRSIDEMKRLGAVTDAQSAGWLKALNALIPDVQAGDRLTGIQRPGQAARFFHNAKWRGELVDADFTRLFFGIWLSPRTSEPALRKAMIGGDA